MRNTAARVIQEYSRENKDGFLIAGDAGFGVWESFQEELPTQYINPGITEAATIGMAAGMALSGHKVFYYNIIPFVLMRCYEQVRLDICYQELPVVLIGIGSGITYAPAGMTHYSVEDIALAKTMPNLNIISPSDPVQVEKALEYAIKSKNPTYIRISRSGEPILFDKRIDITQPNLIQEGEKGAVIFHGSISDEALLAAKELNEYAFISMAMIAPINEEALEAIVLKYKNIYVLEEHFEEGGLGTIIVDFINSKPFTCKVKKIAIKNHYIHEIGSCAYLRKHFNIDAASIVQTIKGDEGE